MKKANLFKTQSFYSLFLALIGVLLSILNLTLGEIGLLNIGVGVTLLFMGVFQYVGFKKYYLNYDKKKITWFFPTTEKEQSIDLTDSKYEVSLNWKGLVFKCDKQSFEISLDQFKERDKKNVLKELQAFYA